ncbi:MAG TPA: LD-carboxypeptidase [Thermoanaerobaculia bacterium]|nr:LD-carboxypeptidase [Thermoanaerobaculia bacterium]
MIDRRHFARIAAVSGLAAAAPLLAAQRQPAGSTRNVIKPKRLIEGDLVGLVLPASRAFEAEEIHLARRQLEAIGFRVRIGEHAFDRHGYFAGTDRHRAADINAMFAAADLAGVFCYTGGWGSPRVLPHLDYDLIRRNPKVLIGFSDITALLNAVQMRTGLVTFHGPVAASNVTPYTLENMKRVIMSDQPVGILENPAKLDDELVNRRYYVTTIRGGRARGRIVGGNLTLIAALMGTPYEIDTEGALLFLEDVHEEPYRVDRMLTQLALGGKLDRVAGVVFGRCSDCPVRGVTFSIEEILRDRFEPLGVPTVYGFAFGHIEQKLTLPIGLGAMLDADRGVVEIDEPAVAPRG